MIVVVEFADSSDINSANVTILLSQLEQDVSTLTHTLIPHHSHN